MIPCQGSTSPANMRQLFLLPIHNGGEHRRLIVGKEGVRGVQRTPSRCCEGLSTDIPALLEAKRNPYLLHTAMITILVSYSALAMHLEELSALGIPRRRGRTPRLILAPRFSSLMHVLVMSRQTISCQFQPSLPVYLPRIDSVTGSKFTVWVDEDRAAGDTHLTGKCVDNLNQHEPKDEPLFPLFGSVSGLRPVFWTLRTTSGKFPTRGTTHFNVWTITSGTLGPIEAHK